MKLEKLLKFSELITAFGRVERVPFFPGTERCETDVEHSYQLAMLAWYILSSNKLNLDLSKVFQLALAHDLVEVHAGDTYVYSTDQSHLDSKVEREAVAAKKLAEDYPEMPDVHAAMAEYVQRETREARFVYTLDKLLPIIVNIEGKGIGWKKHHVTLQMLIDKKQSQVALSPEIEPYFNELVAFLREREGELFPNE